MRKKNSLLIDSQKIRFTAARNHFKHMVLRGLHIANKPQTVSLLHELATFDSLIADRTWQSWFASRPPLPQPSKIRCLDQYVAQIKISNQTGRVDRICREIQGEYFYELVHGGLMSRILAPTEAFEPLQTLLRRAQAYEPISPLHLHFDAMDAAGWYKDHGDICWSIISAIASNRILQLLSDRWSPRTGNVYSGFSSDLSLEWAAADEQQRGKIKRSLARMKPNPFERWMKPGALPDWRQLEVSPDIPHEHIYKLLFALAADSDFLVEDRLQAWSLDLATSALAMHALAWTDRYNTMACRMPPELQYWRAFHEILFNPDSSKINFRAIASVVESWSVSSVERPVAVFMNARHVYSDLLNDFGLAPSDLCLGLLKIREERPLIFN